MSRRQKILNAASHLVNLFLWDDRKEDEELKRGEIETALTIGEVQFHEIVAAFENELGQRLGVYKPVSELGAPIDCTGQPIDYSEMDPGIREVVRRLREAGFNTCDSGDGRSKPDNERALDEPHVFALCKPEDIILESRRLHIVVSSWGVSKDVEWVVEANYVPYEETREAQAILMVIGVADHHLPMKN